MAGLWKVKFDYKNGEQRECKYCKETFHATKPVYRCKKCVNANQRIIEEKKRAKYGKKENYPFDNVGTEASNRFCRIRTKLSNAWKEYNKTGDRAALTNHYDAQLKEIQENGILQWIYDRRDKETISAKVLKSRNQTRKDYPDTRGHHEE